MKDDYIDCAESPLFKVKQCQSYKHSSPPISQPYATINTIADTGTTDFLVRASDVPAHLVPCGPTITVCHSNKTRIKSLGSISIPISHSDVVSIAHVIHPNELSHNLSSLSQLCAQGCSATFSSNAVTVTDCAGTVILSGAKHSRDLLWTLPLPLASLLPPSSLHHQSAPTSTNFAIHNIHDAEFVQFVHASFGSPSVSTFHRAVRQGFLRSFPRITARMIRLNPPNCIATAMGHLDRVRQGMASTKPAAPLRPRPLLPFDPAQQDLLDASDYPDITPVIPTDEDSDHTFIKLIRVDEASHSDLTGRFPLASRLGYEYCLISVWRGYIHVEVRKSVQTRKRVLVVCRNNRIMNWT